MCQLEEDWPIVQHFFSPKCEPATKSALNDIINQEYYYEGDFSQTNSDFESKEQSSCGG